VRAMAQSLVRAHDTHKCAGTKPIGMCVNSAPWRASPSISKTPDPELIHPPSGNAGLGTVRCAALPAGGAISPRCLAPHAVAASGHGSTTIGSAPPTPLVGRIEPIPAAPVRRVRAPSGLLAPRPSRISDTLSRRLRGPPKCPGQSPSDCAMKGQASPSPKNTRSRNHAGLAQVGNKFAKPEISYPQAP
jgi:hypothetical protein